MLWITAGVGYLILEAIAAASFRPPYSYAHNYISDLGVTCGGMIRSHHRLSAGLPLLNTAFYLQGTFVLVGAVLVARAVESQNAGLVVSLAATNATGIIVVGTVHGGPIARWHRWGAFRGRSDGRRGRQHGDPGGICHRSERRRTALHATRENPTRAPTDAVVISASVARLVGRRVPFVSRI